MAAVGNWLRRGSAALGVLLGVTCLVLLRTASAGSVPQRPNQNLNPAASADAELSLSPVSRFLTLDIGLAGPPIVDADGSSWLSGRDGQLVRVAPNGTVQWAVGLGASLNDGAALGEVGLLFISTAKNSIVAVQPDGSSRWRSSAPWGIDGPLAWVPGQGLVFTGRDQYLYWLGLNARILQRVRLQARRAAGPVALGQGAAIGLESGELLVWDSRTRHSHWKLSQPIRAIVGISPNHVLALAGSDVHSLNANSALSWSREHVVALGVTTSDSPQIESATRVVTVRTSGQLEWLDWQGHVLASVDAPELGAAGPVPELVATRQCAWISSNSGSLWQCCIKDGVHEFQLTHAPLLRPVLDLAHRRLLVASTERQVWAIAVSADTRD
jgi:hypothetical protein